MKNKIIISLIALLCLTLLAHQKSKIKYLKENNQLLQLQIQLNQIKYQQNTQDLQNRNEELTLRNQELKELYEITQNISKQANQDDCINQPINANIVKLLKKANI